MRQHAAVNGNTARFVTNMAKRSSRGGAKPQRRGRELGRTPLQAVRTRRDRAREKE